MTQKIKCPCCCNYFEQDTEQAICVESFGECIFCRFSPNSRGSKSGTNAELTEIVAKQEVKRRFKNQQPKTIDMEKFAINPVLPMSDEHRAMIQRGVNRTTPPFNPDYNTEAVLVDEMQRMAKRIEELEATISFEGNIRALKHRIHELEGELIGYKKIVADQDLMLERQIARIVDLQTHIENLEGEE